MDVTSRQVPLWGYSRIVPEAQRQSNSCHPDRGCRVPSHDIARVVDTQVQSAEADQEDEGDSGSCYQPEPPALIPHGYEKSEGSIEPNRNRCMTTRERIEGGGVICAEELRASAMVDGFKYGGQDHGPRGGDQEQYSGELQVRPVKKVSCDYEQDTHHPVVTEGCDETHRQVQPTGEGRVNPKQDRGIQPSSLTFHNLFGEPFKPPQYRQGEQ